MRDPPVLGTVFDHSKSGFTGRRVDPMGDCVQSLSRRAPRDQATPPRSGGQACDPTFYREGRLHSDFLWRQ